MDKEKEKEKEEEISPGGDDSIWTIAASNGKARIKSKVLQKLDFPEPIPLIEAPVTGPETVSIMAPVAENSQTHVIPPTVQNNFLSISTIIIKKTAETTGRIVAKTAKGTVTGTVATSKFTLANFNLWLDWAAVCCVSYGYNLHEKGGDPTTVAILIGAGIFLWVAKHGPEPGSITEFLRRYVGKKIIHDVADAAKTGFRKVKK